MPTYDSNDPGKLYIIYLCHSGLCPTVNDRWPVSMIEASDPEMLLCPSCGIEGRPEHFNPTWEKSKVA